MEPYDERGTVKVLPKASSSAATFCGKSACHDQISKQTWRRPTALDNGMSRAALQMTLYVQQCSQYFATRKKEEKAAAAAPASRFMFPGYVTGMCTLTRDKYVGYSHRTTDCGALPLSRVSGIANGCLKRLLYQFPFDHISQAALGSVSPCVGGLSQHIRLCKRCSEV
jgi:hypothetical protein